MSVGAAHPRARYAVMRESYFSFSLRGKKKKGGER
jgi:hypothetical protein